MTTFAPCEDCGKENMDTFACPLDEGFCLACCVCDEHSDYNESDVN